MPPRKSPALKGELVVLDGDRASFSAAQVALLEAIESRGSITAAAKQVGISYKTAWDRIDAMNNLAERPLVSRSAGGAKGGGTTLTDFGREIIQGFSGLQQEHAAFLDRLGSRLHSMNDLAGFLRSSVLRTSADNQFRGVVSQLTPGAVNTEAALRISESVTIIAHVSNDSAKKLALRKGSGVIALVKSSWIILSKQIDLAASARNKLVGTVSRIEPGKVNSEVSIDLGDGKTLRAMITNRSVNTLELATGDRACALFKASSVILLAD